MAMLNKQRVTGKCWKLFLCTFFDVPVPSTFHIGSAPVLFFVVKRGGTPEFANCCFWPFQEPIDWRYLTYIRPIKNRAKGISPENMASNRVPTYLHFRILKFPLVLFGLRFPRSWRYPNSWIVYNGKSKNKWMRFAGTPHDFRNLHVGNPINLPWLGMLYRSHKNGGDLGMAYEIRFTTFGFVVDTLW